MFESNKVSCIVLYYCIVLVLPDQVPLLYMYFVCANSEDTLTLAYFLKKNQFQPLQQSKKGQVLIRKKGQVLIRKCLPLGVD